MARGWTASSSSPIPNGRSDFSLLQHTMEQGRLDELQFCIFDLLYYRRRGPARPAAVRTQGAARRARSPNYRRTGPLRLADQIHSDSAELLARVCNQHLEGLVAKKIDSPYTGDRSANWLKIKCHREQEFVVGGAAYLPGRGTGHVLVAARRREGPAKGLKYAAASAVASMRDERAEWHKRVKQLERKDSPFDQLAGEALR